MFQNLKKRKDRNVGKNWKIACGQRRLAKVIGKKKGRRRGIFTDQKGPRGTGRFKVLELEEEDRQSSSGASFGCV